MHSITVSNTSGSDLTSGYSYDSNGNIKQYVLQGRGAPFSNGSVNQLGQSYYHYDTANQLVREDNRLLGKTFVWTYDDAGNITSCQEYAYVNYEEAVTGTPTKTNTYTYGDSAWGDLLTAYNGVQWSYDQIGNLLSDGTWTYTWQNGRELASMRRGSTIWNYIYDANGMRTRRSNGSKTYNYVYNGSQLTQMTVGSDKLYFTYGALGPTTVTWNGTTYYYALNAQGDVVGIFDGSGNCVVIYNWDNAWGYNPQPKGPMANTLGTLNPLRYRSYVYDQETGLYYLQSRYYDPEIGRFINADSFVSTGQGILGNNMFAYCYNCPTMLCDDSGETPTEICYYTEGEEPIPAKEQKHKKWVPRKDKRKGSDGRQPSNERERNVKHPNGEEHSRIPKGNGRNIHKFSIEELNGFSLLGCAAGIAVAIFVGGCGGILLQACFGNTWYKVR